MIKLNLKNNLGFTIIEVIIAISVSIIIFLIITVIYTLSQNIYNQTDTTAEMTQNGRVILDRMIREIRQTGDIVTEIPETNDDPDTLPEEIMFEDGHSTSQIQYIRYYLDNSDIKRQIVAYYFDDNPTIYVYWFATDVGGQPPSMAVLEDKIIGEYVYDIEFWGDDLININLYLLKGSETQIINTAVYGRNF